MYLVAKHSRLPFPLTTSVSYSVLSWFIVMSGVHIEYHPMIVRGSFLQWLMTIPNTLGFFSDQFQDRSHSCTKIIPNSNKEHLFSFSENLED